MIAGIAPGDSPSAGVFNSLHDEIMSGSAGSNTEAIKIQKAQLALSERQTATQETFMAKQLRLMQKNAVPPVLPGSAPPTPATVGADQAGTMERLNASRRFGYRKATVGGAMGVAA